MNTHTKIHTHHTSKPHKIWLIGMIAGIFLVLGAGLSFFSLEYLANILQANSTGQNDFGQPQIMRDHEFAGFYQGEDVPFWGGVWMPCPAADAQGCFVVAGDPNWDLGGAHSCKYGIYVFGESDGRLIAVRDSFLDLGGVAPACSHAGLEYFDQITPVGDSKFIYHRGAEYGSVVYQITANSVSVAGRSNPNAPNAPTGMDGTNDFAVAGDYMVAKASGASGGYVLYDANSLQQLQVLPQQNIGNPAFGAGEYALFSNRSDWNNWKIDVYRLSASGLNGPLGSFPGVIETAVADAADANMIYATVVQKGSNTRKILKLRADQDGVTKVSEQTKQKDNLSVAGDYMADFECGVNTPLRKNCTVRMRRGNQVIATASVSTPMAADGRTQHTRASIANGQEGILSTNAAPTATAVSPHGCVMVLTLETAYKYCLDDSPPDPDPNGGEDPDPDRVPGSEPDPDKGATPPASTPPGGNTNPPATLPPPPVAPGGEGGEKSLNTPIACTEVGGNGCTANLENGELQLGSRGMHSCGEANYCVQCASGYVWTESGSTGNCVPAGGLSCRAAGGEGCTFSVGLTEGLLDPNAPAGSYQCANDKPWCVQCHAGNVWDGANCIPPVGGGSDNCAEGYHWTGNFCVQCPSDEAWNGLECAPGTLGQNCHPDFPWNGEFCEGDGSNSGGGDGGGHGSADEDCDAGNLQGDSLYTNLRPVPAANWTAQTWNTDPIYNISIDSSADTGTITVRNNSVDESYELELLTYKVFQTPDTTLGQDQPFIENQEPYRHDLVTLTAGEVKQLQVDIPDCAYQIVLYVDTHRDGQPTVLLPPKFPYRERLQLLDWNGAHSNLCSGTGGGQGSFPDSQILRPGDPLTGGVCTESSSENSQQDLIFTQNGTFHTVSGSNEQHIIPLPTEAGVEYDAITVELDVFHGGWNRSKPNGVHNIFWLQRGDVPPNSLWKDNVFGYVNLKETGNNSVKLTTNTDPFTTTMYRNERSGVALPPGQTYRFIYTYDVKNQVRRLVVQDQSGSMLTTLEDQTEIDRIITTPQNFFIGFGSRSEAEGPEVVTTGWEYKNLEVRFIGGTGGNGNTPGNDPNNSNNEWDGYTGVCKTNIEVCLCKKLIWDAVDGKPMDTSQIPAFILNTPVSNLFNGGSENIPVMCQAGLYLHTGDKTWLKEYFDWQRPGSERTNVHQGTEIFSKIYNPLILEAIFHVLHEARDRGHTDLVADAEQWLKAYWAISAIGGMPGNVQNVTAQVHGNTSTRSGNTDYFDGMTQILPGARTKPDSVAHSLNHMLMTFALDAVPRRWDYKVERRRFGSIRVLLERYNQSISDDETINATTVNLPASAFGLTESERTALQQFIANGSNFDTLKNMVGNYDPITPITCLRTNQEGMCWYGTWDDGAKLGGNPNGNTASVYAVKMNVNGQMSILHPHRELAQSGMERGSSGRVGDKICATAQGVTDCLDLPTGEIRYVVEWDDGGLRKVKGTILENTNDPSEGGGEDPPVGGGGGIPGGVPNDR